MTDSRAIKTWRGSCHCQAVVFEVQAPAEITAVKCNCSICSKSGFLHLIVPRERFRLIQGEDMLSCYRFNTGVARHTFCRVCGIKPFYTPRSHPDAVDINVHCLDTRPGKITINQFDGQHWEQHIQELPPAE